jgi:segregation and condensation protein B
MTSDPREMVALLEAILFVANEPVPRAKLIAFFGDDERPAAEAAFDVLLDRYRERETGGLMLDEAGGGWRLVTRPDLHTHLRRFFEVTSSNKLSMAALETLAIIAYRQPITGPEIQELRGVSSAGVLRKLLERRLVRIAGRKEVVGKPFLYATTREFLLHFGLANLKELPPLEQFEELFGSDPDLAMPDPIGVDLAEEAEQQTISLETVEDERFRQQTQAEIDAERSAAEAVEGEGDEPEDFEAADEKSAGNERTALAGSHQIPAAAVTAPVDDTPSGDGEEKI